MLVFLKRMKYLNSVVILRSPKEPQFSSTALQVTPGTSLGS